MYKKEDLEKIPCKNTFFWEKRKDGTIAIGLSRDYILNKEVSLVWELIDDETKISGLIIKVTEQQRGKIDTAKIRKRVIKYIEELRKLDLITFQSSMWKDE